MSISMRRGVGAIASSRSRGVFIAVGDGGKISRSVDSGAIWSSLITNPFGSVDLVSAAFGDGVLVVGGAAGKISRSLDKGLTWSSLITNPFGSARVECMAFGDGEFVAGSSSVGSIARSTDGGATWGSLITTGMNASKPVNSIAYDAGGDIFNVSGGAASTAQTVKSTDGGATWGTVRTVTGFASNSGAHALAFGNDVWVCMGDGGEIGRSTDDGDSWSLITDPFPVNTAGGGTFGNDVFLLTGNGGGNPATLARSTDDGASWSAVTKPALNGTNSHQEAVGFGNDIFLIGGEESTAGVARIMRSTNDGANWTNITNPFGTSQVNAFAFLG